MIADVYAGLLSGENVGEVLEATSAIVDSFLVECEPLFDSPQGRVIGSGVEEHLPPFHLASQRMVISAIDTEGQVIATATGELIPPTS